MPKPGAYFSTKFGGCWCVWYPSRAPIQLPDALCRKRGHIPHAALIRGYGAPDYSSCSGSQSQPAMLDDVTKCSTDNYSFSIGCFNCMIFELYLAAHFASKKSRPTWFLAMSPQAFELVLRRLMTLGCPADTWIIFRKGQPVLQNAHTH